MNMNSSFNSKQQLTDIEHLVQQLISQTQQASTQYQMLLEQEKQNAVMLEQIAQKENHAAQVIQTALQGHQTAVNQLNQIKSLCSQITLTTTNSVFNESLTASNTQTNTTGYMNN